MKTTYWMIASASLLAAAPAHAQSSDKSAGDALGQCLVLKSTGQDRLTLVRWMASAMLASPQVADLGQVAPAKREGLDRDVAAVFTRLMTRECLALSRVVAKGSTTEGFRIAGEALGKIAMENLVSGSQGSGAFTNFSKFIRPEDFKVLNER